MYYRALFLVLLALHTLEASASPDDGQPLLQWLRHPVARRDLLDTWRRGSLSSAFNAYNSSLPSDASARLDIVDLRCVTDVYHMINTKALWSLSMLDASVKIPVGLLAMVWTHLGNWEECVQWRDVASLYAGTTFHGQMCNLRLRPQLQREQTRETSVALDAVSDDPSITALLSYMQLTLAVCVPSSCRARDVQMLFRALTDNLPVVDGVSVVASVKDGDCTTVEKPGMVSSDIVAVMVLTVLATLVVLSTMYDLTTPEEEKSALSTSFSVLTNGRKLLAIPRAGGDDTLSCLHGMRFLSMCWVVMGHRYQNGIVAPSVNPDFQWVLISDFWHVFLTNAALSVDTFFVLSGLLLGYLFFKGSSARRLNIPMYYLHRIIRLTPALAMMVLLTTTLIPRAGWGPLWAQTMNGRQQVCRENWWNTLLYVGNYVRPSQQCMPQTWYLMVDMQLHLLSPLVLIPLLKEPKFGMVWILVLCVGGIVSNFLIYLLNEFPGSIMEALNNPLIVEKINNLTYFPTYARFVPYLVGLAVGYLLAIHQVRGNGKAPLAFFTAALGWLVVAALMLSSLMVYHVFLIPPFPSRVEGALYNALSRPMWSVGVVGAVYLCARGNGGWPNEFLSWWGFHILGRLSYSVYLVHGALQNIQMGSLHTLIQLGDGILLYQFCCDLVVSLVFAAILSLVCESPFMVLEKELLGKVGRKKKTPLPVASPAPSKDHSDMISGVIAPDGDGVTASAPCEEVMVHSQDSGTPCESNSEIARVVSPVPAGQSCESKDATSEVH